MPAQQKQRGPPALPPDTVYTSCYCEENIYLLAQAFASNAGAEADWPWQAFVVFISNHGKTVALWNQKAREDVVVWDYHVVLVLRARARREQDPAHRAAAPQRAETAEDAWVYDLDSRLAVPSGWADYVAGTFPYVFSSAFAVSPGYQSCFRVVPAAAYLDYFVSDRSHMVKDASGPAPHYASPPPPYPSLCGTRARELGISNNLMDAYVSMAVAQPKQQPLEPEIRRGRGGAEPTDPYGEVMSLSRFLRWAVGETGEDAAQDAAARAGG